MQLVLMIFLCLLSITAQAADFNVTQASDADCSDLDCDLQSALNAASNNGQGDTLHLAPGVFNAPVDGFLYSPDDGGNDGLAENFPIVLEGDPAQKSTLLGNGGNSSLLFFDIDLPKDDGASVILRNLYVAGGESGVFIRNIDAYVGIEKCVFAFNQGGGSAAGLGVVTASGVVNIQQNGFVGNQGKFNGGGLYINSDNGQGNIVISNNLFALNVSDSGSGGGLYLDAHDDTVLIAHNTFTKNKGGAGGGALLIGENNPSIFVLNNILWNNEANLGADLYLSVGPQSVSLADNDFSDTDFYDECSDTPNCVSGVMPSGNIHLDPLFVNPDGDAHLQATSPCIDEAMNIVDLDFDLEGAPRLLGEAPDMGAYEFSACGDGSVNAAVGEECDDGNLDDGDGCSSACSKQPEEFLEGSGTPEVEAGNPGSVIPTQVQGTGCGLTTADSAADPSGFAMLMLGVGVFAFSLRWERRER